MKKVYVLIDDLRGGEIRFVGVCEDPEIVLTRHESLRENQELNDWVTSCIRSNFPPIVKVIEEMENPEESLRVWIETFRRRGHELFN